MSYLECSFKLEPFEPHQEILIARLSELGFDSFYEDAPILKAYIEEEDYRDEMIREILDQEPKAEFIGKKVLEKINWNEEWEKNFHPLSIDKFCHIRAPFHPEVEGFEYELIIEPKMSFGTGHHATTQGMISLMKELDWPIKKVLDVGSGTGILAILAAKMGASTLFATDIEDWAYENMQENFERNDTPMIKALKGSLPLPALEGEKFDLILANINKNVLLEQIPIYSGMLNEGGKLLLSGFYENDLDDILELCSEQGLVIHNRKTQDQWMAVALMA